MSASHLLLEGAAIALLVLCFVGIGWSRVMSARAVRDAGGGPSSARAGAAVRAQRAVTIARVSLGLAVVGGALMTGVLAIDVLSLLGVRH